MSESNAVNMKAHGAQSAAEHTPTVPPEIAEGVTPDSTSSVGVGQRTGELKHAIRVKLPNGFNVFATPKARRDVKFLYGEIFRDRCYEQHGIEYRVGGTVVDVGANFGLFALRVMQLQPTSRVLCVEPVPPIYACLAKNVAAHAGVSTFNLALSDKQSLLKITFYPHTPANSTLDPDGKVDEPNGFANEATLGWLWRVNKLLAAVVTPLYPVAPLRRVVLRFVIKQLFRRPETYNVRTVTLDTLITQQELETIDLLKVDVEGAERDVLSGLSDDNLRRVRQLVIEISPHHKAWIPALEGRLRRCGFSRIELVSMIPDSDARRDAVPCTIYAVQATTIN